MSLKWRYLLKNQKIGIGFSIVIVILLLINGLLAMQYASKSKETSKQSFDQSLNVIDKMNINSEYEESQISIKNLQNADVKSQSSKTPSTKSSFTSIQTKTIVSDIDNSIESADSGLGLADQNIDLSNLTK
ncbi:MAG: hypothetical protein H7196_01665 [candidate division SR1 bacterium]|nr:hypothetical protein [candidate division SR1 bacterium]